MSNSKVLVIYHGGCTDGFTAAWCAHRHFADSADYMEMKNDGADFPVDGRDVIFLDCCPRREQLLDFKRRAKTLLVLDHHITNANACSDVEGCSFDMNKSGAGLAASKFLDKDDEGWQLVSYVQDNDLFRFSLPNSQEIREVIFSYPFSFSTWDVLSARLARDFNSAVNEGAAIRRSKRTEIEELKKKVIPMTICGYENVPVVNVAHGDISLLLSELAKDAPNNFAIAWHHAGNGRFKYSIRSTGAFDCAEFARVHFGGGGHRGAAAWIDNLPAWEQSVSKTIFRR